MLWRTVVSGGGGRAKNVKRIERAARTRTRVPGSKPFKTVLARTAVFHLYARVVAFLTIVSFRVSKRKFRIGVVSVLVQVELVPAGGAVLVILGLEAGVLALFAVVSFGVPEREFIVICV